MRIEHGTQNGNRIFLGTADNFKVMHDIIARYLNSIHFRSRYTRLIFDPECWCIDYGSWSDFIFVSELPEGAYDLYMEQYEKKGV